MTIDDWETSAAAVADGLLPFQAAFVAAVCRKEQPPEIAALSCPRGNGKSWLCGGLVARSLTPSDPLFGAGGRKHPRQFEHGPGADRVGVRAGCAGGVGRLPLAQ